MDEKPASKLFIPTTVPEVQSLLDNTAVLGDAVQTSDLSADNYYLDTSVWRGLNSIDRNLHTWARDIYEGQGSIKEWNLPYQQILYANTALEALATIPAAGNEYQWNALEGAALFIRGYSHFNVAQLFAPVYDELTATSDLGIPLRLNTSVTDMSRRSNLHDTYAQIIADVHRSVTLLPKQPDPQHPNRPSQAAAYALLSRICLSMRNYVQAGAWADSCLAIYNKLLDYNNVSTAATFPFTSDNPELLYNNEVLTTDLLLALVAGTTLIDSTLFRSYGLNDLRCPLFFTHNSDGQPIIRSSYSATIYPFQGLAVDEVLLTKAECQARLDNVNEALNNLNTLLRNRYKKGSFTTLSASDANQALQCILQERRKELPFRGTRWMDIRRLNKEGAGIRLVRMQDGVTYSLEPNDRRFVLPIPPDVIALTGMEQNPR